MLATDELAGFVGTLEEAMREHADAIAVRERAYADRNAGDQVRGEADARLRAREFALRAAERRVSVKRTQVTALEQKLVIAEVRENYGDLDARGVVAAKVAAVGVALEELIETVRVYNAASDEAGRKLEAAGVLEQAEVDGVAYNWARRPGGGGRVPDAGYDVLIDGELVAWGASSSAVARGNHEDTLLEFALKDGLRRIGYRLGSNSSERGFRRAS